MEVILFVGIPGSGKSSFFRKRFAETHAHVSKDLMKSARDRGARQAKVVAAALAEGKSVVVDNTHCTREERAAPIAQAKAAGARVVGYFFDVPKDVALARNARREGKARVPEVAIHVFSARMKRPVREEGFDELYRVDLEGNVSRLA